MSKVIVIYNEGVGFESFIHPETKEIHEFASREQAIKNFPKMSKDYTADEFEFALNMDDAKILTISEYLSWLSDRKRFYDG